MVPSMLSRPRRKWRNTFLLDQFGSASVAVSVMKLRAAYAGQCLRLRRSSDDAESDFGFTSYGILDVDAIRAWLGTSTGFLVTWYDQSGNGRDFGQSTTSKQFVYSENRPALGGMPGFVPDMVDDMMTRAQDVIPSGVTPCTMSVVFERMPVSTGGTLLSIGQASAGKRPTMFAQALGRCEYNGSPADSPASSVLHSGGYVLSGQCNDVINAVLLNGYYNEAAATALDVGTTEANLGARVGGASPTTSIISEAIVWPTALANWNEMHRAQRRSYGLLI